MQGDVVDQGRNVVVCGPPDAAFSWQQLQYRWPNKPSPGQLETHMRGTLQEIGLYRPSCLFWYKAECTPSTKMYVRSVGGLAGLVAARHGGPEKFDGMKDLAAAANHVVLDVLNDINQLPFNIVTMDFVSDQVLALPRRHSDQSREWVDGSWVKWVTKIGWVTRVMGQEHNGSLGSWVTLSDPFPALTQMTVLDSPALDL